MRDALLPHNIFFSLCEWGWADVQVWGNRTGNSWRVSDDISNTWPAIIRIIVGNAHTLDNTGFYGHGDADMLEVGNGQSVAEARTHFAVWAAMKSPLILGTKLDKIASNMVTIVTNKYLLDFNQDEIIGEPAKPFNWDWNFNDTTPPAFWSGASSKGVLVLMTNYGSTPAEVTTLWQDVPELDAKGNYEIVDIWTGNTIGCYTYGMTFFNVASHDTAGYMLTPCPTSSVVN